MTNKRNESQQRQAILWGRYSSEKQSKGVSEERQLKHGRAYAERNGIKVIAEHFDPATSVKDGPTKMFMEVMATLPAGVGILAEDLDRISRGHPIKQQSYILDLVEKGHFVCTFGRDGNENVEYNGETMRSPNTLAISGMKTSLGYGENQKRIQGVRDAKARAIQLAREKKAAPLGGWLPFHLKYNPETHQYDFNKDIAAITETIFKDYLSGKGTRTICKGLNDSNTPTLGTKRIGGWTGSTICKLLRNERAIGTLTINGERIPNAFPPAISEDLFYKVQDKLSKNVNRRGKYSAEKVNNVFRGRCHCSVCNSAVKVYKNKYLGCSGYRAKKKDNNGNPCSVKTLVPFAELEREFLSWFVPHAKDALLGEKDSTIPSIDALEAKKKAVEQSIETAMNWLDSKTPMPEEQIKSRLSKLEVEKRALETAIAEAKAKASSKATQPDAIKQLETIIQQANLGNQAVRRQIANIVPSLVKSITIDISDKLFPSFNVVLSNGKAIAYTMTLVSHYGLDAYKGRIDALQLQTP